MDISDSEQDDIDWIVARMKDAETGPEIAPYVDEIVSRTRGLLEGNPGLMPFANDIHGHAARYAIAEWAANSDAAMADSAWDRLANDLGGLTGT